MKLTEAKTGIGLLVCGVILLALSIWELTQGIFNSAESSIILVSGIFAVISGVMMIKGRNKNKEVPDVTIEQLNSGVSKLDYYEAAIKSLLLIHPEAREQQPFIDYRNKLQKYVEQHLEIYNVNASEEK